MKRTLLFLSIIFFTSCSNNKSTGTNDINKREPSSIIINNDTANHVKKDFEASLENFISTALAEFDTSYYMNTESRDGRVLNQSDFIWVKRLKFKKKQFNQDQPGTKYYKRFELIAYEYKDSLSCSIALNSWLNHFGTGAFEINRWENLKAVHSPPIFVIITPRQITAMFMACEYIQDDWVTLKNNLIKNIVSEDITATILECGCGGPITWTKINSK